MVRLYSLSVQICLEIFCLELGGKCNYLRLEVKIILSGWFLRAFLMVSVCLMATSGVKMMFLPHLAAMVQLSHAVPQD